MTASEIDRRLASYGSLAPGRPNHHQVAHLGGTWSEGHVHGHLVQAGWGAAIGFRGIGLDPAGPAVPVSLLVSDLLPGAWPDLDTLEGTDYRRVPVRVHLPEGEVDAWIYVLADLGDR